MGIRSSVDIGSLRSALQSPGIDSRFWLTLAVVLDVAFDAAHGMFADVRFLSTGDNETIIVGDEYAGDDFGSWPTLRKDDVVLVAVPDGDMGSGGMFLKRMWSASHKPPKEFANTSSQEPTDASVDPTTVVEPGRTLRVVARDGASVRFEISGNGKFEVVATGAATVNVQAESTITVNSPDVRLGTDASAQVACIGDLVVGPGLGVIIPPSLIPSPVLPVPAVPPFVAVVGQIVSGRATVKAGP